MRNQAWLKALLIFTLAFLLLALGGRVLAQGMFPAAIAGDRVALVTVEGMITADSASGGVFGGPLGASSVAVCDELYSALEDDSVKAVVLRINSPGGSAAGSDEIYRAILAVKAKKKVVASMGDIAASGGYYIASACDHIYANGATLTGSIGVIFSLINWGELANKYGVKEDSLHAGQFKDIGSPWRPMKPEERTQLEGLLSQVHDQFIKAVDEGRPTLDEAAVRKLATGMVFTGEQAAANGLIDEVGGLEAAKAKARQLAGLPADAPVEPVAPPSLWDELFGMSARGAAQPPQAVQQFAAAAAGGATDGLSLLARGLYLNATLRDLQIR